MAPHLSSGRDCTEGCYETHSVISGLVRANGCESFFCQLGFICPEAELSDAYLCLHSDPCMVLPPQISRYLTAVIEKYKKCNMGSLEGLELLDGLLSNAGRGRHHDDDDYERPYKRR